MMDPLVATRSAAVPPAQLRPSFALLGADAFLAVRPATPVQLVHACTRAGYDAAVPASWGDELIAERCVERLAERTLGPAVFCACSFVREQLMAPGPDLAPFVLSFVAPPVAAARYLRQLHAGRPIDITYIGACPSADDEAIDRQVTPKAFIAELRSRGIILSQQPTMFNSTFAPDRRRCLSQPGGVPTSVILERQGVPREVVEIASFEYAADLAQHLIANDPVLVDLSARAGCLCSGATSDVAPQDARTTLIALEPPRSAQPIVEPEVLVAVDLPLAPAVTVDRAPPVDPPIADLPIADLRIADLPGADGPGDDDDFPDDWPVDLPAVAERQEPPPFDGTFDTQFDSAFRSAFPAVPPSMPIASRAPTTAFGDREVTPTRPSTFADHTPRPAPPLADRPPQSAPPVALADCPPRHAESPVADVAPREPWQAPLVARAEREAWLAGHAEVTPVSDLIVEREVAVDGARRRVAVPRTRSVEGRTLPRAYVGRRVLTPPGGVPALRAARAPRADARPELGAEMGADAATEMRADAGAGMRPDAGAGMRPDADAGMRPDAGAGMRADAGAEMRGSVRAAMRAEVRAEMRAEMRAQSAAEYPILSTIPLSAFAVSGALSAAAEADTHVGALRRTPRPLSDRDVPLRSSVEPAAPRRRPAGRQRPLTPPRRPTMAWIARWFRQINLTHLLVTLAALATLASLARRYLLRTPSVAQTEQLPAPRSVTPTPAPAPLPTALPDTLSTT